MVSTPTLSVFDRARQSQGALLMGCGGGGDIIQTIPVMNFLGYLGVERFVLGDYAIKWWNKPGSLSFGCEVLDLEWLHPAERIHEDVALISPSTRLQDGLGKGKPTHEAVICEKLGATTISVSLNHGAKGVRSALEAVMRRFDLSLLMFVDIGADTFYSGHETTVMSPLADAISLAVAQQMDALFGLSGYGCDAEMPLAHLDRNVGRVMQMGGFLGAYGLTPRDVADLHQVLEEFPDEEVEQWPCQAAMGNLGTQYCKGWWAIEVTPLAAVTLFFDPAAVCRLNPLPSALAETTSLREAEELLIQRFALIPETRLPPLVEAPISP